MADPKKLPLWMRLEICCNWFQFWHAVRLVYEFTRDGHGFWSSIDIAWAVFWNAGCWEPIDDQTWHDCWRDYVYYQKHRKFPNDR